MNNYEWNIDSIGRWNKRTFPNNTTRCQRIKCMNEAKEYYKANTYRSRIEELADFYIANAGLYGRFSDESGMLICELMKDLDYWDEINNAVQEKMQINLSRKWYKTTQGEWRHVENDEKTNVRRANTHAEAKSVGNGNNR